MVTATTHIVTTITLKHMQTVYFSVSVWVCAHVCVWNKLLLFTFLTRKNCAISLLQFRFDFFTHLHTYIHTHMHQHHTSTVAVNHCPPSLPLYISWLTVLQQKFVYLPTDQAERGRLGEGSHYVIMWICLRKLGECI